MFKLDLQEVEMAAEEKEQAEGAAEKKGKSNLILILSMWHFSEDRIMPLLVMPIWAFRENSSHRELLSFHLI